MIDACGTPQPIIGGRPIALGGAWAHHHNMTAHTDLRSRRSYGAGILLLGGVAGLGLATGVLSQIVLFGDQADQIEAALYRPLIVPCAIALAAAVMAGVAWWLAFLRERTSPLYVVPGLAVAAVAMIAGLALQGPSERELETRWTKQLAALRLPAGFTPLTEPDSSGEYVVSRQWATAMAPEQACPVLEQALAAWMGTTVGPSSSSGCQLSGIDGNDTVTASFEYRPEGATGPQVLGIALSYAT